ncbi:MAG: hypothetical protein WAN11_25355 [Syntrophobacteraceae bacterium]
MGAAVALSVASLVASAGGAIMQGYAQSQSADYNAQVAQNNQIIANQNAGIALQQGQRQEEAKRIQTGEMIGGIKAGEAASGVNPNTGSALNVRSSAAETGQLDALTIRYNANMTARNDTYQGAMYGSQAAMYSAAGNWDIANSILGGASSVSNKWLQYNQMGVFGNQPSNSAMYSNGNYMAAPYYLGST